MFVVTEAIRSCLERLSQNIDELVQEDLRPLTPEEQAEGLQALVRERDRLDAEIARRLRHFDRARAFEAVGSLSAAAWLAWKCRLSGGVASWRMKTARLLQELPATAQAFAEGAISYSHVSVVASCARQLGTAVVAEAEPILVEAARKLDARDLRRVTARLRYCLDPNGTCQEDAEKIENSTVHLSESLDGVYYLNGTLDPEAGNLLHTALEALIGKPQAEDHRSRPQKRAEALVELARRSLDAGDLPTSGGERPHLTLTSSLESLRQLEAAEPGGLLSGEPLHPQTVRRLACDCTLTPLALGPDGEPVAIGMSRRVISRRKKKALEHRDRGCRMPGCGRPAAWTDAHHIKHWADGGGDELSNLLLLCRRHHVMVHELGYKVVLQPDGEVMLLNRWEERPDEPP